MLQGAGGRRICRHAIVRPLADQAREVEAERQVHDVGVFIQRPLDGPDQGLGGGDRGPPQYLPDERPRDPRGNADASPGDGSTEQGAGDMRAVSVRVAVALTGEVPLHQVHALKGRVSGIDPGVQHRDGDGAPGVGARQCTSGGETPGGAVRVVRSGAWTVGGQGHGSHQPDRDGRGDGAHLRVAAEVPVVAVGEGLVVNLIVRGGGRVRPPDRRRATHG